MQNGDKTQKWTGNGVAPLHKSSLNAGKAGTSMARKRGLYRVSATAGGHRYPSCRIQRNQRRSCLLQCRKRTGVNRGAIVLLKTKREKPTISKIAAWNDSGLPRFPRPGSEGPAHRLPIALGAIYSYVEIPAWLDNRVPGWVSDSGLDMCQPLEIFGAPGEIRAPEPLV
jgi:hypothetical protein